ncbi:MarR family winged helix-turn-helix transcriptional regulator [Pseudonocardia oroxyli]|uniref:Transcriptional regulator, MarR family n=1 Tax=Pseudonocardia oroxyli TaxID=366584 RepID=A0A1G8D0X7_PSEOR|nr:MarR family transcriptional regulator [Pseudonocardia oroxyli]SDH51468.1 transcriptional regulator, MarR family [Pseudonocardia oroxyli]
MSADPDPDLDRELISLVVERNPATLTTEQVAAASRIPLTMIGSRLRETTGPAALTAPQSLVLSQLTAVESLPITDLANADGRAVSTMTEIVGRLSRAGLVRKHNGTEDRRQVLVSITEEGRRALAESRILRNEWLTRRITELGEHERVALAAALPALWRIAGADPEIWPRVPPRSDRVRRTRRSTQAD